MPSKKKIVMPKIKKITQQDPQFFNEQAALYSNKISRPEFIDEHNKKTRIQLPESFTMTKPKAIDTNKFVEGSKTTEWTDYVHNDIKNVRILKDREGAEIKKQFNHQIIGHENYKYDKRLEQEIAKHAPISLIAKYAENIYTAFGNSYAALNQIGLMKSIAQLIAPKPTENEEQAIKNRIIKMDVSLLTDYYAISQIIQSPFLNNYINSFYTQFQEFKEGHEYKFIMSFLKSIVNYVSLNKDKIGIPSFITKFWNIFYGSQYTPAPTTPPYTENFTMPPIQFTSDSTLPPTERVAEVVPPPTVAPVEVIPEPTVVPTIESTAEPTAETTTAPVPATRSPEEIRRENNRNELLTQEQNRIYNIFLLGFTTRASLEALFLKLTEANSMYLRQPGRQAPGIQIRMQNYAQANPNIIEEVRTVPTIRLVQPMLDAINETSYLTQAQKLELNKKGVEISNDAFFFQP